MGRLPIFHVFGRIPPNELNSPLASRSIQRRSRISGSNGALARQISYRWPPDANVGFSEQETESDFYRYTMKGALVTAPGVNAVYSSASPNLYLAVAGRPAH